MDGARQAASVLALGASVLALATACAALDSARGKPFGGEDEILYGPEAKPATVHCEQSDALDELEDYDHVWACEVVFKDGSGRITNCWARRKSTESTFFSFNRTCAEWAVELRASA
jgi:hypothetical protein